MDGGPLALGVFVFFCWLNSSVVHVVVLCFFGLTLGTAVHSSKRNSYVQEDCILEREIVLCKRTLEDQNFVEVPKARTPKLKDPKTVKKYFRFSDGTEKAILGAQPAIVGSFFL
jgi:hypothetical protein